MGLIKEHSLALAETKSLKKNDVVNRIQQLEDFARLVLRKDVDGYTVIKPKRSISSGKKYVKLYMGSGIKKHGNYAILILARGKLVTISWSKETDAYYWNARNRGSSQIILKASSENFIISGVLPKSTLFKFMKKVSKVAPIVW